MKNLKSRGYKEKVILPSIQKAVCVSREVAIEKVITEEKGKRINLPVTFNPQLPNYSKIIKQHWQYMVEQHPDLKNIFSAPPRVCYRRPKNLRDILVKAQVPKPSTTVNLRTQKGFKRCGATRCMSCIHSVNKTHHKSSYTGKSWPIYSPVTCNTRNVIYTVTCTKEGGRDQYKCRTEGQYVGLTTQMAKNRWNSHRNSVKPLVGEVKTGISQHFNKKGHSISHMQFLVIEEVRSKNPFVLKARESYWIKTYGAVDHGINIAD